VTQVTPEATETTTGCSDLELFVKGARLRLLSGSIGRGSRHWSLESTTTTPKVTSEAVESTTGCSDLQFFVKGARLGLLSGCIGRGSRHWSLKPSSTTSEVTNVTPEATEPTAGCSGLQLFVKGAGLRR
jgi:hypothetical protein